MTQVKKILYQNTYKVLKIEYKYTLSYILEIMCQVTSIISRIFFQKKKRLDIVFYSSSCKMVAISSKILVFSLWLSLLAHLPVPTVKWDCCKLCMAGTVVRAHTKHHIWIDNVWRSPFSSHRIYEQRNFCLLCQENPTVMYCYCFMLFVPKDMRSSDWKMLHCTTLLPRMKRCSSFRVTVWCSVTSSSHWTSYLLEQTTWNSNSTFWLLQCNVYAHEMYDSRKKVASSHTVSISMYILWNSFSGQLTSHFEDLLAATISKPDGSWQVIDPCFPYTPSNARKTKHKNSARNCCYFKGTPAKGNV